MEIKTHTGTAILPYIEVLANWRIEFFKVFPYLYDGTLAYEQGYISGYAEGKDAMLVTVHEDNEVVAIASGIALLSEHDIVADATSQLAGLVNINTTAYLGEIIIQPAFRGKGLSKQIIATLERFYKNLGYSHTCFLTVIREKPPMEPVGYVDPQAFWGPQGYIKTNITTIFNWPTIQPEGQVIDAENELVYWVKTLD